MPPKKKAASKVTTPEVSKVSYTVPGLSNEEGASLAALLQDRLNALTDLHLTLKHVHWNVVGPHFIAVHEMLDPQVDAVRDFSDAVAERIATLGGSPQGTPGRLVATRTWDDYSLGRGQTQEHMAGLDLVYDGVNAGHREAIETAGDVDPVTEDILIGQLNQLEKFQWFVRAHLESAAGQLQTEGESTEAGAARRARPKA